MNRKSMQTPNGTKSGIAQWAFACSNRNSPIYPQMHCTLRIRAYDWLHAHAGANGLAEIVSLFFLVFGFDCSINELVELCIHVCKMIREIPAFPYISFSFISPWFSVFGIRWIYSHSSNMLVFFYRCWGCNTDYHNWTELMSVIKRGHYRPIERNV